MLTIDPKLCYAQALGNALSLQSVGLHPENPLPRAGSAKSRGGFLGVLAGVGISLPFSISRSGPPNQGGVLGVWLEGGGGGLGVDRLIFKFTQWCFLMTNSLLQNLDSIHANHPHHWKIVHHRFFVKRGEFLSCRLCYFGFRFWEVCMVLRGVS